MEGGRRGRPGQRLRAIRPLNRDRTPIIKEMVMADDRTEWPTDSLRGGFCTAFKARMPLPPL